MKKKEDDQVTFIHIMNSIYAENANYLRRAVYEWFVSYINHDEDSQKVQCMTVFEYDDKPLTEETVMIEVKYSFDIVDFYPNSPIEVTNVKKHKVGYDERFDKEDV